MAEPEATAKGSPGSQESIALRFSSQELRAVGAHTGGSLPWALAPSGPDIGQLL